MFYQEIKIDPENLSFVSSPNKKFSNFVKESKRKGVLIQIHRGLFFEDEGLMLITLSSRNVKSISLKLNDLPKETFNTFIKNVNNPRLEIRARLIERKSGKVRIIFTVTQKEPRKRRTR